MEEALLSELGLDQQTRLLAEQYFKFYKAKDHAWTASKAPSLARVAALVASKVQQRGGTCLNKLLSGSGAPDLQGVVLTLKEFLKVVDVEEPAHSELERIINSFAFSLTFFTKFEELWGSLGLPSDQVLKSFTWLCFAVARVNLLQRRAEVVECACMLIGVLQFIQAHGGYLKEDSDEALASLCSRISANPELTKISYQHFTELMEQLKQHHVLITTDDTFAGLLGEYLQTNFEALLAHYQRKLLPDDIDEREFLSRDSKVSVPVLQKAESPRFLTTQAVRWPEDDKVSFSSKLSEIKFPYNVSNSPCALRHSVFSSSHDPLESKAWIQQCPLPRAVEPLNITCFNDDQLRAVGRLKAKMLESLLQTERESEAIVKNETFQRALQACSAEAVCFTYEIKQLSFQHILKACEVSAFDTWKVMSRWVELELRLPYSLGVHLRGLCRRVITSLAWSEEAVFDALLKTLDSPSARVFSRKLLSESALRISELCADVPESIREEIWSSIKTVLSEHTELLRNRHLDQILLCTIYGASKALQHPLTFNNLISKYSEIYPLNSGLFRAVFMDSGSSCDVITFYNEVFIGCMQAHLVLLNRPQSAPSVPPRVPALHPPSPLRLSLPQPIVHFSTSPAIKASPSPFISPRSSAVYAFGESPSHTLEGINRLMQKSGRCINFDIEESRYSQPRKRSKHMEHILEDDNETLPTFPDFAEPDEFV
jgi:hypothetical protein